jgi:hypothetical protein
MKTSWQPPPEINGLQGVFRTTRMNPDRWPHREPIEKDAAGGGTPLKNMR